MILTPWCRILFEKPIVTQFVKKYPAFLWNPKVHYRVHISPPLGPILSQPNPVRPIDIYLPKVQLNVILPPTPSSSQWSLTFGPPNQNPPNTSPLPHACHMSRPPHSPWLNHPNNIRWRTQVMKFIIMHFSPRSVFLPFRSKYPQHSVLKNLSLCSSHKVRDQVSHPYSTTGRITVLYILIFRIFDMRREDERCFCP
jgi:hypothetical protein